MTIMSFYGYGALEQESGAMKKKQWRRKNDVG
jgi:hypothetical protein